MDKRLIIELEPNGVVTLSDAPGTELKCLEGTLWLTEDGAQDDVVLERGRAHEIGRKGRTVVQALEGSRLAVYAPTTRAKNGVRPHFWQIGTVPI